MVTSADQSKNDWRPTRGCGYLLLVVAGYLALSILTLPFTGSLWIGEIPVIALIQLPIVYPANWLRTAVVMPLIRFSGLSAGSYSPDYGTARPYALLLYYLLTLLFLSAVQFRDRTSTFLEWRWAVIVVCLMCVDGLMILKFGTNPWNRFTIY